LLRGFSDCKFDKQSEEEIYVAFSYPDEAIVEHQTEDSGSNGAVFREGFLHLVVDDFLHVRARRPVIPVRQLLRVHGSHTQGECSHYEQECGHPRGSPQSHHLDLCTLIQ